MCMWLDDARIVKPCLNATDPTVGLSLDRDHTPQKLYLADTGLLVAETFRDEKVADNTLYRDILLDRLDVIIRDGVIHLPLYMAMYL